MPLIVALNTRVNRAARNASYVPPPAPSPHTSYKPKNFGPPPTPMPSYNFGAPKRPIQKPQTYTPPKPHTIPIGKPLPQKPTPVFKAPKTNPYLKPTALPGIKQIAPTVAPIIPISKPTRSAAPMGSHTSKSIASAEKKLEFHHNQSNYHSQHIHRANKQIRNNVLSFILHPGKSIQNISAAKNKIAYHNNMKSIHDNHANNVMDSMGY